MENVKKVVLPEFGLFLKKNRLEYYRKINEGSRLVKSPTEIICIPNYLLDKGLSVLDLVNILAEKGAVITRAGYYIYEAGKVSDPDIKILKGLSLVYNISYDNLVQMIVNEKYGTDLCL